MAVEKDNVNVTANTEDKNKTKVKTPRTKTTEKKDEASMLKKEVEDLKKQLEAQLNLIKELNIEKENVQTSKNSKGKNIPFINLTCGTLNLLGHRIYSLEGQFSKRSFPEKEAVEIINNSHNAVIKGLVYIADSDFVEENDLSYIYETLLSDMDLKSLLKCNIDYVVDVYKQASLDQKRIISDMISQKVMNKEPIDANILIKFQELTGIKYMELEPFQTEEE